MKAFGIATLCLALAGSLSMATADPWKDESGKGRERGGYARSEGGYASRGLDFGSGPRYGGYESRERKVEYDDGRCKVERKWGKHGDYKEEVKCRGFRD